MSIKEGILNVMGGEHVAALATLQEGKPAVRFLAIVGTDDLTLIGATMESSAQGSADQEEPGCSSLHLVGQELYLSICHDSRRGQRP